MFGKNCIPPSYVRAIEINNPGKHQFNVVAVHKSGEQTTHNVTNDSHRVEREISKGTYSVCDPIVDLHVTDSKGLKQAHNFDDVSGVKVHKFTYKVENNLSSFVQH